MNCIVIRRIALYYLNRFYQRVLSSKINNIVSKIQLGCEDVSITAISLNHQMNKQIFLLDYGLGNIEETSRQVDAIKNWMKRVWMFYR